MSSARRAAEFDSHETAFTFRNDRGNTFELYPHEYVDRVIYVDGIYERRLLEFVSDRFGPGAIALDIGANVGNHAIWLSRSFSQIHCFEPNPTVLSRLRRNIELNGLDNVIVHPVGLADQDAELPFRENLDGNLGASGFLHDGEAADAKSRAVTLPIAHADRYVQQLGLSRIDFIKVDVEGWEPALFKGLASTIARTRPVIAFEFHGQHAAPGEYDTIRACLPGYLLMEPVHAPAEASGSAKLLWNLRRGGQPDLVPIDVPQARTYENILAFPDQAVLDRWR